MKKFTVLQCRWIERGKDADPKAAMIPVMTLNAKTPVDALRIAKQKGQLHPIIHEGEYKEGLDHAVV